MIHIRMRDGLRLKNILNKLVQLQLLHKYLLHKDHFHIRVLRSPDHAFQLSLLQLALQRKQLMQRERQRGMQPTYARKL